MRLTALVLAGGLLATPALAHSAEQPVSTPSPAPNIQAQRLAALGRLWAFIRYFDPTVSEANIDWDRAWIEAVPKVEAAQTQQAYADAVRGMLETLHDPATRLAGPPDAKRTSREPADPQVPNDIAVIRLGALANLDYQKLNPELEALEKSLATARGVIVDLRGPQAYSAAVRILPNLKGLSIARRASGPLRCQLVHHGFGSQGFVTSGMYGSAIEAHLSDAFEPHPGVKPLPVAFVMHSDDGLPDIALAFQAAGNGFIVSDAPIKQDAYITQFPFDVGDGLQAFVRVDELRDGSGLALPQADATAKPEESLYAAALKVLAHPPKRRAAAKPVAGAVPALLDDRSYAEDPYPSEPLRLLAAVRVWSVASWFYPYRHLLKEDWDQILVDAIPTLQAAQDAKAYGMALAALLKHIPDGHTTLFYKPLNDLRGRAFSPVEVTPIDGQYVVTRIFDPQASGGLHVGDVIDQIDGQPIAKRMEFLSSILVASRPDMLAMTASDFALSGAPGDAQVIAHGADGKPQTHAVHRVDAWRADRTTKPAFKVIGDNVGFLDLEVLTPDQVDQAMEAVKNTRALVIDLRNYPRSTAWTLAPRLNSKHAKIAALFYEPLVSVTNLSGRTYSEQPISPSNKWVYDKPVVTLINHHAISQSEHTALFIEAAHGTTFIGSRTAGANGDITRETLPGGATMIFTGHDVRHADGRQLQQVGIVPDIEVHPTLAGIRAGRDEVLERALEYLRGTAAPASGGKMGAMH